MLWCVREGESGAPEAPVAICMATGPTNASPVPGQAGMSDERAQQSRTPSVAAGFSALVRERG
jgi:hypothetical protein